MKEVQKVFNSFKTWALYFQHCRIPLYPSNVYFYSYIYMLLFL